MAFNFFGTFTSAQWEAFRAFTVMQSSELDARVAWLKAELLRVGIFETSYDNNNTPVSFTCMPVYSYGAKLLSAYRVLGGEPERDFLLRTRNMPVYLKRSVNGYSDEYTNGRVHRGEMRNDRDIGLVVEKLKWWQLEAIKMKREHLEFKIKRTLDYSDQLDQELQLLKRYLADETIFDFISSIQIKMVDNVNVVNKDDRFGLDIPAQRFYDAMDSDDDKLAALVEGGAVAKTQKP